jgi:hypothetical protein
MRLTWKDGVSTILVVAGLAMAFSVVQAWGWPLLGGVREGIIALGITGLAACILGAPADRFSFSDPYGLLTMVLSLGAIAIAIVGGLAFGTVEYLYVLMAVTGGLWVLATIRHAVDGTPAAPGRRVFG